VSGNPGRLTLNARTGQKLKTTKALTRGRTDHFEPWCYLFTVSDSDLLFIDAGGSVFSSFTFHFQPKAEYSSSCDLELSHTTLTYEYYTDRVKLNHHARYHTSKGHFIRQLSSEHTHADTNTTDRLHYLDHKVTSSDVFSSAYIG